jgi:PPOX class probable F420-dependent enzyme
MKIDEVQDFLVDNHRGVLVARKRNGSPQITLITPSVDAAGRVIISARKSTFKVKNLTRDPQVSLLVMGEQFNGSKYFQVEGQAEIIALPDSMDPLMDFYRRTYGDEMTPEETRKKIIDEDRVIIRIEIENVGPQNRG